MYTRPLKKMHSHSAHGHKQKTQSYIRVIRVTVNNGPDHLMTRYSSVTNANV